MGALNPNYFIHAANLLLLVAYTVRDILWLRLFALASSLIALPYFALQPTPLWEAISWSMLFAVINLFQAWRLSAERRPVKLTPEEQEIRDLVFRDLPPRKLLQVLSIGSWSTAERGEYLLESGKRAEAISLIVRGKVRITRDKYVLGELAAGDIVGSALMLSGASSDVDAVAVEQVRSVRWEVDPLDQYLAGNPETRMILQKCLARDLARKLNRSLAP
jgi:Popeye protein conserved region